jgi:ribosomal protein S18 acetylase RimI-like enzyme
MAVDDKHQGKGIGKKLMMHMEELAQRKGCSETVLHAREIALPFYQKLGYHTIEKSHLLFDEIQHYLMSKKHEHSR